MICIIELNFLIKVIVYLEFMYELDYGNEIRNNLMMDIIIRNVVNNFIIIFY